MDRVFDIDWNRQKISVGKSKISHYYSYYVASQKKSSSQHYVLMKTGVMAFGVSLNMQPRPVVGNGERICGSYNALMNKQAHSSLNKHYYIIFRIHCL